MDRLACVDIAALPLQLLLARQPGWAPHPVVVVAEDRPQAPILWTNARARSHGIVPGMRYTAALSLCAKLRADTVEQAEVHDAVERITRLLHDFSPGVQPSEAEPGVFWLDAGGFRRLVPSLDSWGQSVLRRLGQEGLQVAVVVGFSRFGTYALARQGGRREEGGQRRDAGSCGGRSLPVQVCHTAGEELNLARAVSLEVLAWDPALRDALGRLGICTVEQFLRLPRAGVLERFGPQAHHLHGLASGSLWDPLVGQAPVQPVQQEVDLEHPEEDLTRLMFLLKRALDPMLAQLSSRGDRLASLLLILLMADGRRVRQRLRPAKPTLDVVQILELVRLRLEALTLDAHVDGFQLEAEATAARARQLQLFERSLKRDQEIANQALARVRAELGPGAVTRAVLHDRHLPEARFGFEPLASLGPARPAPEGARRRLVRRLLLAPTATKDPAGDPRRTELRGGPHIISGGWWQREVCREYHFVQGRGCLQWIFYDHARGRWMLHGVVE